MDTVPFFSVCIPTYNRAHLLSAAIDSVLAQDFEDYELVIVDNASTDHTQEMLKQYDDPRVRIFRNADTVSMYANHNKCIEFARAEWIVFLHSDDCLKENGLATLKRCIKNLQCDVIYPAKALHQDYLGKGVLKYEGLESLPSLLRWPAATPSGAAYRRDLLNRFKFDETLVVSDLLILADILKQGNTISITSEDIVKIGTGEFQYSSKWHKSGAFITDVSVAFKRIINIPGAQNALERQINTWSDSEISFLLMMLSHADQRDAINRIEKKLGSRISYKKDKKYRHVMMYKLFGFLGLRTFFKTIKYIRKLCHG